MKELAIRPPRPLASAQGIDDDLRPDLRVRFSQADGWEVTIVSERAAAWAQQHLPERQSEDPMAVVATSLEGVNEIVKRARSAGYRSEYLGSHVVVRL